MVIDLMRPDPEHVRCCICFTLRTTDELLVDPQDGKLWDICATGTCAEQAGMRET